MYPSWASLARGAHMAMCLAFCRGTVAYVCIHVPVCMHLKVHGHYHGNLIKQLVAHILFQVSVYQWLRSVLRHRRI